MADARDNDAVEGEAGDAQAAGPAQGADTAQAGESAGAVQGAGVAQAAGDVDAKQPADATQAAESAQAAEPTPAAEPAQPSEPAQEQTAAQQSNANPSRPASKMPPLGMGRGPRRLVASSFGLLAVAGIAYGLSVPGLVSAMEARVAQAGGTSIVGSVVSSVSSALTEAVSALATEAPVAGTSAAATGDAALRGSASLSGAGSVALANTTAAATTGAATDAAATSPATDAATDPASPDAPVSPDTPISPDEPDTGSAEDEEFHAYLVSALDELDGYVSQVNGAIATFNANAATASLGDRLVYAEQCDSLTWSAFGFYGSILNHPAPSGSKWAGARENLIGAANRLYRYIAQYDGAWDQNVQYEYASAGIDDWMEPVRAPATEAALSEFNSYYARIAL